MVTTADTNNLEAMQTKTEPTLELDPSVRLLNTASGIQDSSITVVENPKIAGNIGILFSRSFRQEKDGQPDLTDSTYFRFNLVGDEMCLAFPYIPVRDYNRVRILRGRQINLGYNFLYADEDGVIGLPSTVPYDICFLDPDKYDELRIKLSMVVANYDRRAVDEIEPPEDPEKTAQRHDTARVLSLYSIKGVLGDVHEFLAEKVPGYSLSDSGRLVLPRNYASLAITPNLHPHQR